MLIVTFLLFLCCFVVALVVAISGCMYVTLCTCLVLVVCVSVLL